MKVLNMLNTKYFIDRSGKAQINPGALVMHGLFKYCICKKCRQK